MSNELKILILEDDAEECFKLNEYAKQIENIVITGCTASVEEALLMLNKTNPDAVIIDLELHNGSGNGLQFLSSLQKTALSKRPYLLVTTNNSSQTTHEAARSLGADFILTKYELGYNAKYVIDFLIMMHGTISNQAASATAHTSDSFANVSVNMSSMESNTFPSEHDMRLFIHEELNKIGISPKAVGYQYLTDSILIKSSDCQANIFVTLAPRYKKSDPSIERAMQYAINRAWRMNDPDDLLTYYTARIHSERGVPTIMEFIYYYATKVRTHFKIE